MNTDIEIFKNDTYGEIRTLNIDGEPWFVAADVCRALELDKTWNALQRLDDDEKGTTSISTLGGNQNLSIISESGLYSLVLGSRKPEARDFKRWIPHSVIPEIRKHGIYMTKTTLEQVMDNPELIYIMADRLTKEHARAELFSNELNAARPKAEYFDAFIHPEDCTNIRAAAKELQVPERWFCRFLLKAGFVYRCPAGNLMPYNNPKNDGLFRVKDYVRNGHKGAYTLITPKGKDLLRQLIRDCGERNG